jgi:hypothetical protein
LRLKSSLPSSFGLDALRARLNPTASVPDLLALTLAAAVVTVWASLAAGRSAPTVFVPTLAVFLAFYLAGSLFAAWRSLADDALFDLPLRLCVGYAVVNTALFALAWVSPLGIIANFGIVFALVVLLFVLAKPSRRPAGPSGGFLSDDKVGLMALGLSLVATTLWCQDWIRPASQQGEVFVYKPWIDSFYHAITIRIFGDGHGAATLEDFRLAGVPTRLYHYGVYLTPSFISQASGLSRFATVAGILAPLGVLFTGLGAYALVGSVWGRWPGLVACAALFLLPDGSQQGVHNPFMSYHWLTQISPSATYGLMLLALAWLFVIRGCLLGRWGVLLLGWIFAGLLLLYKAHFIVANGVPLLLMPAIFVRAALPRWKRALWVTGALGTIVLAVRLVPDLPGVPLIRFDGSSARMLLRHVADFTVPGGLRTYLLEHLGAEQSLASNLLVGIPFVLFAILGFVLPLLITVAIFVRKRTPPLFLAFPFVIVLNFMAMFLGLALDMRSSTPDELSHRPLMVMYFVVVAWLGGAVGLLFLEARRLSRIARPALLVLSCVLMVVPAIFGAGVHRMWALPRISPPVNVPTGLVHAVQFVRDHSDRRDLLQDSRFDRYAAVAALSERRPFVARSMTRMPAHAEMVEERVEMVEQWAALREASAITESAHKLGIRWYLLTRGDTVNWPEDIANHPAFEEDGYKIYRF